MKKAISPLISYILLIGMVVAMSTIVATYLIKQSSSISFESKEFEIYCADVAMDAQVLCLQPISGDNYDLKINLTNRGSFSVFNLTVVRTENNIPQTLVRGTDRSDSPFLFIPYDNNEIDETNIWEQINPGKKALFEIIIDSTKTNEITITPWISIEDKAVICNEKFFKVISSSISNAQPC